MKTNCSTIGLGLLVAIANLAACAGPQAAPSAVASPAAVPGPIAPRASATPPVAPPAPAPAAVAEVPARLGPRRLGVQIRAAAPARFVLDGDVTEWQSLQEITQPEAVSPPDDESDPSRRFDLSNFPAPDPKGGPAPVLPLSAEPQSFLAVALTSDGLTVAGDLGPGAARGFWLSFGSPVSPIPNVGRAFGRASEVLQLDCDTYPFDDSPLGAQTSFDCAAIVERQARFVAQYSASFQRRLWVAPEGVRSVDDAGKLVAVPSTQVVFKALEGRVGVELRLPVRALPRMGAAPLEGLRLLANEGTSAEPPMVAAKVWPSYALSVPFVVEPLSALRAYSFGLDKQGYTNPYSTYTPSDPLTIETLGHRGDDTFSVILDRRPLYARVARLRDVEVGYVATFGLTSVVTLRDGVIVDEPMWYKPDYVSRRGGELHLFYNATDSDDSPFVYSTWWVKVVRPDGSTALGWPEDDGSEAEIDKKCPTRWRQVRSFHDAPLLTFGLRGVASDSEDATQTVCTWRWSTALGSYGLTIKRTAAKTRRAAEATP